MSSSAMRVSGVYHQISYVTTLTTAQTEVTIAIWLQAPLLVGIRVLLKILFVV